MNTILSTEEDLQTFRIMASEAFDMLLTGAIENARKVFYALEMILPGNRPSKLGLTIVEQIRSGSMTIETVNLDEPLVTCFQCLVWLKQGQTDRAIQALKLVIKSGKRGEAFLASQILNNETEEF